jgi:NDP-sugar pyrophosphorylase family protein
MLLTAGFGRRMLPLTLTLPKPAIPVLGQPLALQILEQLARNGIERAVLNLHHLPQQMRRLIEEAHTRALPKVSFTEESEILGTAGGIANAAPLLRGEGPILVRNSDFLADIDLSALLVSHQRSGMQATLVLAPHRPGYSTVAIDRQERVISIAGIPEVDSRLAAANYLFTGCHLIEESLLERIPAGRPSDIVRDIYRDLAAEGGLGAYIHHRFWWEFGTPELYLDGSLALLDLEDERRAQIAFCDPVRRLDSAVVAIGAGAQLHATARLQGRAALGASSRVHESASLEESILMPGAAAGAGCRLRRALLAPGVQLPAGATVDGALVCRSDEEQLVCPFGGGEGAP